MQYYIAILIAAVLSMLPLFFVKKFVDGGEKYWYCLGLAILCSILLIFTYVYLCRRHAVSKIYAIIKILSIIMLSIVGYLFLNEVVTTKYVIGIVLGIIALYLLLK